MSDDFQGRGGSQWGNNPGGNGNGSGRGPTPPDIEANIKDIQKKNNKFFYFILDIFYNLINVGWCRASSKAITISTSWGRSPRTLIFEITHMTMYIAVSYTHLTLPTKRIV